MEWWGRRRYCSGYDFVCGAWHRISESVTSPLFSSFTVVTFVGNGTSTLNLFDDHLGNNAVNVSLPDLYNVTLLSRENFLVFLHNVSDVNTTEERINVERGLADEPTVTPKVNSPFHLMTLTEIPQQYYD